MSRRVVLARGNKHTCDQIYYETLSTSNGNPRQALVVFGLCVMSVAQVLALAALLSFGAFVYKSRLLLRLDSGSISRVSVKRRRGGAFFHAVFSRLYQPLSNLYPCIYFMAVKFCESTRAVCRCVWPAVRCCCCCVYFSVVGLFCFSPVRACSVLLALAQARFPGARAHPFE